MNDITIFIFDAQAGMKLSRDIILSDGSMLAPKDTVLTPSLIAKISSLHVLEINIYNEEEDSASQAERNAASINADKENANYYEKVRNSEEYKHFESEYNHNVDSVKDNLNSFLTSDESIDTDSMVSDTMNIVSEARNSLQMFDMLHAMRNKDDLTYVHSVNVALIASIIGKWLNFSEEDIKILTLAGLLHDIGKLLVPDKILNKPGALTDNEYEIMKHHVNLGYEQIKDKDLPLPVKEAVLLHHEKCDGSGYPFGLKSDDIPVIAKIITIADVYDAMTAARIYRASICPFEVVKMMYQDTFTKFDPVYVVPFLKNVVASYIGTNVKLSDGRTGKVVLINDNALHQPIVQCVDEYVDLSKTSGLNIVSLL